MEKLNLQSNFVNIYVSGSFQNKGKINLFINELRKRGFNITFDWTIEFSTIKDHNKYHISSIQAVNGIRECDILIAIFNSNTDISRGIFTEIGAAIGMGKRVMILNENHSECITWLPSERIETCIYYHHEPLVKVYTSWAELVIDIPKGVNDN